MAVFYSVYLRFYDLHLTKKAFRGHFTTAKAVSLLRVGVSALVLTDVLGSA